MTFQLLLPPRLLESIDPFLQDTHSSLHNLSAASSFSVVSLSLLEKDTKAWALRPHRKSNYLTEA